MFGDGRRRWPGGGVTGKRSSSKTGRMDVRWSPAFSSARPDLLTPEVAIAVCYAGLPRTIGPRPGTVTAGAALPPVAAARLRRLNPGPGRGARSGSSAAGRPGAGCRRRAPATGTHRFPYSFLSASSSGRRGAARTALLLWGLRRTAGSLLGRADGRRGWSFSTFELPLSDMDPGNAAGHRLPLGTGGAAGGAHDNAQGDPGPAARPDPCGRRDRKSASGQVAGRRLPGSWR